MGLAVGPPCSRTLGVLKCLKGGPGSLPGLQRRQHSLPPPTPIPDSPFCILVGLPWNLGFWDRPHPCPVVTHSNGILYQYPDRTDVTPLLSVNMG